MATRPQDRYILVENCPSLADYYDQLVAALADISLRMDEHQQFSVSPAFNSHPYEKAECRILIWTS